MNILENRDQLVTNNTTLREQVLSMVRNLPEQTVDISQQATATADKILAGYIGAYKGELVEGTASAGVSGIDYGEVTLTNNQTSVTITHGLNQTPSKVYLLGNNLPSSETNHLFFVSNNPLGYTKSYGNLTAITGSYTASNSSPADATASCDATNATFTRASSSVFLKGNYIWIAIA